MRIDKDSAYDVTFERVEIKSPFNKDGGVFTDIIISKDFGVEVMRVRMNAIFTKMVFKFLYDLWLNGIPFSVQLPPSSSIESVIITGERACITKHVNYDYYLSFRNGNIDGERTNVIKLLMTSEMFDTFLCEKFNDVLPLEIFTEDEYEDYENIDLSYIAHHRFHRN